MHLELSTLVDAALDDDGDFNDAWERLGAALDATPDDAGLLRLRVRMAEACGEHVQRVADLERLAAIDPDDRAIQLAYAAAQYRWAFLCAMSGVDEAADEDGEVDADDEDEGALDEAKQVLESQALARLVALADAQHADAGFMLELLAAWDDAGVNQPWLRLRLIIQALAACPTHTGLRRALALHWADLTRVDPAGYDPALPPPIGFLIDATGAPHDALLVQRALAALQTLIDADPEDLPLLESRAALNAACAHYAEAAADHAALAAAWEARARQAQVDARDERDDLLQRAEVARTEARHCAGGRAAIVQASLADMEQAAAGIGAPFTARPGQEISDAKQAMLDEMQASMQGTRETLLEQLTGVRSALEAASAEPDAAQRAEIAGIAQKIGPQVVGALQFAPSQWLTLSTSTIEAPLHDWLTDTGEALQALGWRHLAWCENPAFRRMFGEQVVTGLWVDAAGTSLAVAAAVKTIRLVEIETEFADGTQLTTTASRGKNFTSGGPMIDQLLVDTDLPLDELARLHRARVALRVAEVQAVPAVEVRDVATFAAIQERQRVYKLEFRRAEGLSEFEARGLPTDHPEHLIPAVQRAVREALNAALEGLDTQ